MGDLPSGTVSLLFSDVEGSTLLLQRLGPVYQQAVDGQRKIQRAAWAEHGGIELGTEGDSFFVVFATAESAVLAAVHAQRELAAYEWPNRERLRVRMGIHTGAPAPHDGSYVGMDVHRAARIAAAAHGGQVLVSRATAGLVTQRLPAGVSVKDLGDHQLKDIASPERIYQLDVQGLQTVFPPIRTLGTASSLPHPTTPLLGRDGELRELGALLGSSGVRLVTLTGPGGIGKTRLALGVAERMVGHYPDGAFFVPLAAVAEPANMFTAVAEALDVPPDRRAPVELFDHIRHRTALLLLDNVEQIAGADAVVAELLENAPGTVVIATSRRPLNLPGEHVHAVPPLELPDATGGEPAQSGAVQMFATYAHMARATFALDPSNTPDVVGICRRLDGLPLAIELAAARARLLSPAALLARLDDALDFAALSSRTQSRHRTLRDTIAWSYDLLDAGRQAALRRLAVIGGTADLDAVSALLEGLFDGADALDVVGDLVDASLVTLSEDDWGEPRVGMLQTIRSYALQELEVRGELGDVRWLHANHYLTVAEVLRSRQYGSRNEYLETRRRFAIEQDNFRELLEWALSEPVADDRIDVALELCRHLCGLWVVVCQYDEMARWLEKAIALAAERPSPARAYCMSNLAFVLRRRGDAQAAPATAQEAVTMLRRLGTERELADGLVALSMVEDDLEVARRALDEAESLLRVSPDLELMAMVQMHRGLVDAIGKDYEAAFERFTASRDLFQQRGDADGVLRARANRADLLRILGRLEESQEEYGAVVPEVLDAGQPYSIISTAQDYGALLAERGALGAAVRLLGSLEARCEAEDIHLDPTQEGSRADLLARTRSGLAPEEWEAEYRTGAATALEVALAAAHRESSGGGGGAVVPL